MKKLITILAIVALASPVFAAGGRLSQTNDKRDIQGFSPNGTLGAALTVNSVTYDMSYVTAYGVYVPATGCKIRSMATPAKGTNLQRTVVDGIWNIRVVNPRSPFVNFSGCFNGELTIHD